MTNNWINHVKSEMKLPQNKGKSLKEVLKSAKISYKKK